jgi:hypothetical protein
MSGSEKIEQKVTPKSFRDRSDSPNPASEIREALQFVAELASAMSARQSRLASETRC